MKKNIIALIVIATLTSCGVPHYIKQNFTYCYDGQNTGIDTLINIDGYYKITCLQERDERYTTKGQWVHKIDTLCTNLMFYKDGIFVNEFNDPDRNRKDIQLYFKKLVKNKKNKKLNARFYGIYKIYRDTIKTQYINYTGLTNTWMAYETWYKVINKGTIKIIAGRQLFYDRENPDKSVMNLKMTNKEDSYAAVFIPVEVRPGSDCWLKNKKWFWCKNRK